jgi:NAD(P)-dependent dehydrogenase (short-subunit alcohol dehydrogenase family)
MRSAVVTSSRSHRSAVDFRELLARDVAPLGIRVTCVEPGGLCRPRGSSPMRHRIAACQLRTDLV